MRILDDFKRYIKLYLSGSGGPGLLEGLTNYSGNAFQWESEEEGIPVKGAGCSKAWNHQT